MIGLANRQCPPAGWKPVLTFRTGALQMFAERQKRFRDICLLRGEVVAKTALALLCDSAAQEKMGRCGRQRMGEPGGARKLALRIKEYLA